MLVQCGSIPKRGMSLELEEKRKTFDLEMDFGVSLELIKWFSSIQL